MLNEPDHLRINLHESLLTPEAYVSKLQGRWPSKTTAIMVMHGIGNQKPLETIDIFARGILSALITYGCHGRSISMSHQLVAKKANGDSYFWFDNFIRIQCEGHSSYIDIYEYYWANRTEDKTNLNKIFSWLRLVTSGAKKFYKKNARLSASVHDKSIFVNEEQGFNYFTYLFFIYLLGSLATFYSLFMKGLVWFIRVLPFGQALAEGLQAMLIGSASDTANILGDISIYNEVNPRSELYNIRKEILNGAVKAIRFLLEPEDEEMEKLRYQRVVVTGHSLGSQISFDAINRLTHQVHLGELDGYDHQGYRINKKGEKKLFNGQALHISQILDRYYTFGSPLDKIAFFLREQCDDSEYIRVQMLQNFHCFKQRTWDSEATKHLKIDTTILRLFDSIQWKNYYHNRDYVSGSLDYYHSLTNVQCNFSNKWYKFTHSNYWYSNEFFGDLLVGVTETE